MAPPQHRPPLTDAVIEQARRLIEDEGYAVERAARTLGLVPRTVRAVAARKGWERPVRDWHQVARVATRLPERGRKLSYTSMGRVLKRIAEGAPRKVACGIEGVALSTWEDAIGLNAGGPRASLPIPGLREAEARAFAAAAHEDLKRIRAAPDWRARQYVAQLRDAETFGRPAGAAGEGGPSVAIQINVGEGAAALRPRAVVIGPVRPQLALPSPAPTEDPADAPPTS